MGIILISVFWKAGVKDYAKQGVKKLNPASYLEQSPESAPLTGSAAQAKVQSFHSDIAAASFFPNSGSFAKKIVIFGFCLLFFCFGGWRFVQKESVGNLNQLNDKGRLILIGTVVEEPDKRAKTQKLVFETERAIIAEKNINVSGRALITTGLYPEFEYGDEIQITGKLETPLKFQNFDYKNYLAKSDIYSVSYYPEIKVLASNKGNWLKKSLFWLKGKFESVLEKSLPEPQAGFLDGLLLGQDKQLPVWLSDAFKKTGTAHITALSGYNITMVASFFMTLFGLIMLKKAWRFWLAALGIVFFTILTGASASAVRAAIMGGLVLTASQAGWLYNVRNALVFAGGLMVFLNPKIIHFDIGFQLSFGATAGLIWLAPLFQKAFKKIPRLLGLKEILTATLSAQLAVLPLLLVHFGQLSIISPLANLAVLMFIPLTMLLGFICGGLGLVWVAAGRVFGWIVWLFLTLEIKIVKFFAGLPLAATAWRWDWLMVLVYYLVLILLLVRFHQQEKSQILVEMTAEK